MPMPMYFEYKLLCYKRIWSTIFSSLLLLSPSLLLSSTSPSFYFYA